MGICADSAGAHFYVHNVNITCYMTPSRARCEMNWECSHLEDTGVMAGWGWGEVNICIRDMSARTNYHANHHQTKPTKGDLADFHIHFTFDTTVHV